MRKDEAQELARRLDAEAKARFGKHARVTCGRAIGRGRPQVCEVSIASCRLGRASELLGEPLNAEAFAMVIEDVEDCLEDRRQRLAGLQSNIPVLAEALAELRAKQGGG